MNNDGLYHQPRWVNAIVIAGCVAVILSQYVTRMSQAFVLLAVPLLFLFVGICNRVRSGAFFPRWAERKRIAERLDSENARRISEAELAVIEREVSAGDTKPRSLHLLCKAVLHIATKLEITVRENWLQPSNLRSNGAVEFRSGTRIVSVEIRNGKYECVASDASQQSESSEYSEEITSTLAWNIAGHPFGSKSFRKVYFSLPSRRSQSPTDVCSP
jgi:hypothetical protein